jgi:polyphosphate kinase
MINSADFLNSDFPSARSCGIDMAGPDRFLNRELSWLAFNWRVLEEVDNVSVPLLERLRFLSISATNLDEFYSVRVAGLRELARSGNSTPGIDGRSSAEQLELIDTRARDLMAKQQSILANLRIEMAKKGIHILTAAQAAKDYVYLQKVFLAEVFPVVSPLAIDPAHPFPFIPNAGFALALQLERKSDKRSLRALVPIPQQVNRFVQLPGDGYRYLPLEELILMQLEQLFPGYKLKSHCAFSVLRDSDLEVEDEAEDLVREFEVALKRRRRGEVIRLKISTKAPKSLRKAIMAEFSVTETEVV